MVIEFCPVLLNNFEIFLKNAKMVYSQIFSFSDVKRRLSFSFCAKIYSWRAFGRRADPKIRRRKSSCELEISPPWCYRSSGTPGHSMINAQALASQLPTFEIFQKVTSAREAVFDFFLTAGLLTPENQNKWRKHADRLETRKELKSDWRALGTSETGKWLFEEDDNAGKNIAVASFRIWKKTSSCLSKSC